MNYCKSGYFFFSFFFFLKQYCPVFFGVSISQFHKNMQLILKNTGTRKNLRFNNINFVSINCKILIVLGSMVSVKETQSVIKQKHNLCLQQNRNLNSCQIEDTYECPAGIFLFKVNNRKTTIICEISFCSGVFIVNSERISHIVLVFPLLTLNKKMTAGMT